MAFPRAIGRGLLALALGCTGEEPITPGTPPADDSAPAVVDSEAPIDWTGRVLTFADYWGVHVVDLERQSDTRVNNYSGGGVYLSPESERLLYATSGAGTTSELSTLDGEVIEDFAGVAVGFAGPDYLVTAAVDGESLAEGPLYSYQISERKSEVLYNLEGRDLVWSPHGHHGEHPSLLVLDRSDTTAPTLVSFAPPVSARTREMSVPEAPVVTIDGRVAWLDAQGELWSSDLDLTEAFQLSSGLGGLSVAPWREPGRVLVAYDGGEGRRVRVYDLLTRDIVPLGDWADIEGFDPAETRVHGGLSQIAFRVDSRFYLADPYGGQVELVAEGFGVISGWDW